jgi:type II secretory pathway component PulM
MIQMAPREKSLAVLMVATLGVWATWTLAIKPARERIGKLERIVPEKRTQLRELQARSAEYVALANEFKGLRERMASQDPSFQLLSFLEKTIDRHKLAGHATMRTRSIQPRPDYSETVVTIELQDVALRQIINFLTDVETTDAVVRVGSLHIRKDAVNDALLDSTVEIHSPRTAGNPAQVAQIP